MAGQSSTRNRASGRTTQSAVASALQCEALGGKFAQNDVQGGDDREGTDNRDGVGARHRPIAGQAGEQRFEQLRQRGLADPAERERRDGDAELRRRQVGVEMIERALQGGGVHAAPRDQLGDAAATNGDEGELGGDEEAVGEHQQHDRHNTQGRIEAADVGHGLDGFIPCRAFTRGAEGLDSSLSRVMP
jgi:hypothetical protein